MFKILTTSYFEKKDFLPLCHKQDTIDRRTKILQRESLKLKNFRFQNQQTPTFTNEIFNRTIP